MKCDKIRHIAMKLPKPPSLSELNDDSISQTFLNYLLEHTPTDAKGRYLSWEEFRHRYPTDSKQRWLAQKLNRNACLQWLEIGEYKLSYCIPHALQAQLHDIEQTYHRWQWHIHTEEMLLEEPITSAQLEGASTTRKVAKELLDSGRMPKDKSEVMVVNNYRLMKAVKQHLDQPLDVALILRLHHIATEGAIENNAISGKFRQDDDIVITDYDGQIIHQPPPWHTLPALMQACCDFINHNDGAFVHPIIKAVILHFLIGFIHPFGDGNGRTARSLFYWYLQKSGFEHFDYISISRLLHKAPKQYAQSYLNTETDGLDMTYFIAYQLNIIRRAIIDLQNLVATKEGGMEKAENKPKTMLNYANLSIHQHQLLTSTPSHQILTAKQVSANLGISDNTARKLLKELESLGLATTVRHGRGKGYLLTHQHD